MSFFVSVIGASWGVTRSVNLRGNVVAYVTGYAKYYDPVNSPRCGAAAAASSEGVRAASGDFANHLEEGGEAAPGARAATARDILHSLGYKVAKYVQTVLQCCAAIRISRSSAAILHLQKNGHDTARVMDLRP
ncbi:hypothetical protein [Sagittula salina]|uniref:Uncharacterized protein n=1 Tax=Sagittula salina TaxID=2820268 RepID=A0A940MH69_9RHOB|nr:hypothetical protein [Sagittula salina]MBP0481451.1 hypothetical protein [Sagittula salina]